MTEDWNKRAEESYALKQRLRPDLPDSPVFDLDSWMVGWNSRFYPGSEHRDAPPGSVEVGPWPDERRWSDRYSSTSGCCNVAYWPTLTHEQKLQEIVNGFFYLVLGEGLDPAAVHREFWKIGAYRELEMSYLGSGTYIVFQGKGDCNPYNP